MRRTEFSVYVATLHFGEMKVEYPDPVVFVFNPLYLDINLGMVDEVYKLNKIDVAVSGMVDNADKVQMITISLYKGRGRVYLSRMMELFFDDVRWQRSKPLTVQLKIGSTAIWTQTFTAIWGSLSVGERLSHYGSFKYEKHKPYCERRRIWFKNYPFMLSMFSQTSSDNEAPKVRYDGRGYDQNAMVYCLAVDFIFDSIDVDLINEVVEDAEGLDIIGVAFIVSEKRFYGMAINGVLVRKWGYIPNRAYGMECYNKDGEGIDGLICAFNGRLMRYEKRRKGLVQIPYGSGGRFGIYEIYPERICPNATQYVVFTQKGNPSSNNALSVFDTTFDYTFFSMNEYNTITKLIIDNSHDGTYLRWIDRLGMYQYFLFSKGKTTRKNKLSTNTIVDDYPIGDMYFPNHERTSHIDCDVTTKCGAPSLESDIYDYVSTVVTSPIIDMYMGKNRNGDELWVPVNIVASNYEYDPKKRLHDLEITIALPTLNSQSL